MITHKNANKDANKDANDDNKNSSLIEHTPASSTPRLNSNKHLNPPTTTMHPAPYANVTLPMALPPPRAGPFVRGSLLIALDAIKTGVLYAPSDPSTSQPTLENQKDDATFVERPRDPEPEECDDTQDDRSSDDDVAEPNPKRARILQTAIGWAGTLVQNFATDPNLWKCGHCSQFTSISTEICIVCKAKRGTNAKAGVGAPPATARAAGSPSSTARNSTTITSAPTNDGSSIGACGFTFGGGAAAAKKGSIGSGGFNFGGGTPATKTAATAASGTSSLTPAAAPATTAAGGASNGGSFSFGFTPGAATVTATNGTSHTGGLSSESTPAAESTTTKEDDTKPAASTDTKPAASTGGSLLGGTNAAAVAMNGDAQPSALVGDSEGGTSDATAATTGIGSNEK